MVNVYLQIAQGYIDDLKKRMTRYRVSQNALAREMGKNPSQVSRWFTTNPARQVKPELATIEEIEAALERLRKRYAKR